MVASQVWDLYLRMREIGLFHERKRLVEFIVQVHDEHGIQGIKY
jgi:hypothetical protein